MSLMRDMPIKTAGALGLQLRARRRALGLSQVALAERIGVERKWVMRLEAGNPVGGFGSMLRAIDALGCDLLLHSRTDEPQSRPSSLDEVFRGLKPPGKQ